MKKNLTTTEVFGQTMLLKKLQTENARLLESEEHFRLLLQSKRVIIAQCDPQLRYVWIHDPHQDFDAKAVIGKRDTEIMDNEGTRQLERLKRTVVETRAVATSEIAFPLREGPQTYDFRAEPRFGPSGSLEAIVTVAVNITSRKQAEEALRGSEERLRLAMEASATGLWTWNVATNAVTWSEEDYAIHGQPAGEFDGTDASLFRFVHSDDVERVRATIRAAVEGRTRYESEFRVVRPDGTVRWVANLGRATYDKEGRPETVSGTIIDITARKQAEQRLALEHDVSHVLVNAATAEEGVAGVLRTICDRLSVDFCALWLPHDAGQALRYAQHVIAVETPTLALFVEATRELGIPPGVSLPGRVWRSGRAAWVEALADDDNFLRHAVAARAGLLSGVATPLLNDGGCLGVIEWFSRTPSPPDSALLATMEALGAEVGQFLLRKRAEEQLREADRQKDNFLATLIHELRNRLAPIYNGLQVMKLAGDNPDAVEESRSMMERQVGHMTHLIDDLMDLSRIKGGKITVQKARLKVSDVVQDAVDTSRPLIEAHGHELVVDVPSVPIYVEGDLTRLSQVFSNLLNNAAKYTDQGGRIRLAVERQGSDAVVSVTDNGVGIQADMLTRVFDMFSQIDRSLEKSQGGLGIGLNVVKRLVEIHGGSIVAESGGHGKGSTFTVRLPAVPTVTTDKTDDHAGMTETGGQFCPPAASSWTTRGRGRTPRSADEAGVRCAP